MWRKTNPGARQPHRSRPPATAAPGADGILGALRPADAHIPRGHGPPPGRGEERREALHALVDARVFRARGDEPRALRWSKADCGYQCRVLPAGEQAAQIG